MKTETTVTALVSFNDSTRDPTFDFADNVSLVFLEEEQTCDGTLTTRREKAKSVQEYFIMDMYDFICEQGLQEKLNKFIEERKFDTLASVSENGRSVSKVPREEEGQS